MAKAANALCDSGGGVVVTAPARVLHHMPLPIAGLISEAPLAEIAVGFAALRATLDAHVTWGWSIRVSDG